MKHIFKFCFIQINNLFFIVIIFPEEENQLVARLAVNLLNEETSPETLSLVAEIDGEVAGHIAFSPVTADSNKYWLGYILAPLGVKPGLQKNGIGSKLVASGITRLSSNGVNAVFVYVATSKLGSKLANFASIQALDSERGIQLINTHFCVATLGCTEQLILRPNRHTLLAPF